LAHEPEEYAHVTASTEAALLINAASKIKKIKSAFQILQSLRVPGPYAISTFKGFIQGFYLLGRSETNRFP
jgi:hypothetical protein